LGHVPLVDKNPRGDKALAEELEAEARRQKLINSPYALWRWLFLSYPYADPPILSHQ
jgi:hypothetical protein